MKSAARLYAVQALFQMEASGQTVEAVVREFETHRFGAVYDDDEMAEGDVNLFRKLVGEAVNWQAQDRPDDRQGAGGEMADRPDRPDSAGSVSCRGGGTGRDGDAAEGGDQRICRYCQGLLSGWAKKRNL